jgi:hypothetical protein
MKINLLKMNFVDEGTFFSDNQIDEMLRSKRIHLIDDYIGEIPAHLTYMTSRVRDKKLKHKHRPIQVIIRNKINVK